jgi:acyl-CoA reductase-like NAD-dependent aldehyde dehydrogenase
LTKVVLELGGHDPAIVCEDADIENASSGIVWGSFNNCGQNCNAIERVYVHDNIAESFILKVIEKTKKLRIGNGMHPDIDIGPLASQAQLDKIQRLTHHYHKHCSETILGGESLIDERGYFFKPSIFVMCKDQEPIGDEEIFGPALTITPVSDDETAVRLANYSTYGLAASVWTANKKHGRSLAHRLEAGSVMVNDSIVSFGIPEAGWTGIKESGLGWVHGENGLDEMVNVQYVNHDPQYRAQKIYWFPYSEKFIKSMRAGMDFLYSSRLKVVLKSIPQLLKDFTTHLLCNKRRTDKL